MTSKLMCEACGPGHRCPNGRSGRYFGQFQLFQPFPKLPTISTSSALYIVCTFRSTGAPKGATVTLVNFCSVIRHQQTTARVRKLIESLRLCLLLLRCCMVEYTAHTNRRWMSLHPLGERTHRRYLTAPSGIRRFCSLVRRLRLVM